MNATILLPSTESALARSVKWREGVPNVEDKCKEVRAARDKALSAWVELNDQLSELEAQNEPEEGEELPLEITAKIYILKTRARDARREYERRQGEVDACEGAS
jgi:hypothetical protein